MDEIVKTAMAKWPNVPAVYGWLELTARGEWRIRGEPIENASIRDFIARNYTHDAEGNWFFQNGPQRVFVSLEAPPLIYRLDESARLQAHTGAHPRELRGVFADAEGRLRLENLPAGAVFLKAHAARKTESDSTAFDVDQKVRIVLRDLGVIRALALHRAGRSEEALQLVRGSLDRSAREGTEEATAVKACW